MLFGSFFGSYFYVYGSPTIDIGLKFPPEQITAVSPYGLSLLNTLLLLASGYTLTVYLLGKKFTPRLKGLHTIEQYKILKGMKGGITIVFICAWAIFWLYLYARIPDSDNIECIIGVSFITRIVRNIIAGLKNGIKKLRQFFSKSKSSREVKIIKTDWTIFLIIMGIISVIFGGYHGAKKYKVYQEQKRREEEERLKMRAEDLRSQAMYDADQTEKERKAAEAERSRLEQEKMRELEKEKERVAEEKKKKGRKRTRTNTESETIGKI